MSWQQIYKTIEAVMSFIGGCIGYFIGGLDSFMIVLIILMSIDYVTGIFLAIYTKKLSSKIGFKGICKKLLILMLVGIANLLDVYVLKSGEVIRTAVIFFYMSNEGVSILENVTRLGLPIPKTVKNVLMQLREVDDSNAEERFFDRSRHSKTKQNEENGSDTFNDDTSKGSERSRSQKR